MASWEAKPWWRTADGAFGGRITAEGQALQKPVSASLHAIDSPHEVRRCGPEAAEQDASGGTSVQ
jgi:hypothetical protein